MVFSSGKWLIYFFSIGAQGQATSFCPSASGAPRECRHFINSSPLFSRSITLPPTRVMMCILQTTYGLSVISTATFDHGDPTGPIEKGMTYMVRPFMQPLYSASMAGFSSSMLTQLFVGPASSLFFVLIKVRASTLATSLGSERNKKLFSRFFSGVARPSSTICPIRESYSCFVPSHQ